MPDLAGKHGLIVGVANKRSISWAIAQAAAAAGARLALTYPSERLEENVRELAATLDNPLVLPCDVADDQQIADLGATLDREFGGLDFLVHGAAFAPADALKNPFVETSRESFRIALDVSAYSLIGLTRAVAPLMEKRGGGSILTLTFIGSERVFTNYNVMGVAKAALEVVGALPGGGSRAEEHPRQRDLGRRDQDAGRRPASPGSRPCCRSIASVRRCAAASRRRKSPTRRVFLLSPAARGDHRRNPDGRRRLPRHGRS